MIDKINPLTNVGECSDSTYKKAVEKTIEKASFMPFVEEFLD